MVWRDREVEVDVWRVAGERGNKTLRKKRKKKQKRKYKINKSGEHRGRKKRGKTPLTFTGGHRRREINTSFYRIQEGHLGFVPLIK